MGDGAPGARGDARGQALADAIYPPPPGGGGKGGTKKKGGGGSGSGSSGSDTVTMTREQYEALMKRPGPIEEGKGNGKRKRSKKKGSSVPSSALTISSTSGSTSAASSSSQRPATNGTVNNYAAGSIHFHIHSSDEKEMEKHMLMAQKMIAASAVNRAPP